MNNSAHTVISESMDAGWQRQASHYWSERLLEGRWLEASVALDQSWRHQWELTFSRIQLQIDPCRNIDRYVYVRMVLCFSRVQLFATPWTVACQASLSMGFSRQEHWSGLTCPPPRYVYTHLKTYTHNVWLCMYLYTYMYIHILLIYMYVKVQICMCTHTHTHTFLALSAEETEIMTLQIQQAQPVS